MKFLFTTIVLFLSISGYTQQVTGRILESEQVTPIEFATISNLTKNVHAHSDATGKFYLKETEQVIPFLFRWWGMSGYNL